MTPPIRIAVRVLRRCGALGSSARPIFTVFDSMKQAQDAVREAAMRRFAEQKLPDMPLFKQVGMQMVLFGAREPKLYQLLFMQENRHIYLRQARHATRLLQSAF